MSLMAPRLRLAVALLSTGLIFYIALGSYLGRVLGDTTYGQLALFNEVLRIVLDSYLEPVNLDRTMTGADLGLASPMGIARAPSTSGVTRGHMLSSTRRLPEPSTNEAR